MPAPCTMQQRHQQQQPGPPHVPRGGCAACALPTPHLLQEALGGLRDVQVEELAHAHDGAQHVGQHVHLRAARVCACVCVGVACTQPAQHVHAVPHSAPQRQQRGRAWVAAPMLLMAGARGTRMVHAATACAMATTARAHLFQELLGHRLQRVLRPALVPACLRACACACTWAG